MIEITINNKPVGVKNLETFGFKSNFENRISESELSFDEIEIVDPYTNIIDEWLDTYGIGVGIPANVKFGSINIDCYIDLFEKYEKKDRSRIVSIKKRKGLDAFQDYASGVTFQWLASQGVAFQPSLVQYLIIEQDQEAKLISIYIALALATVQLAENLADATELAGDAAEIVQEIPIGASTTASNQGIKIAILIAKSISIATLYTTLLIELKKLVFPRIQTFYACKPKDLIKKACEFKGFTFQSTLLDQLNEVVIIPAPLVRQKPSVFNFIQNDRFEYYNYPFPTSQDSVSTLDLLIKALETTFNAELKVNNGIVRLETDTYFENTASLNISEAFNIQSENQSVSTLNTNEAFIRYYLHYQLDYSDIHSINDNEFSLSEYGAKNIYQLEEDLNLLRGLYDVSIPFTLGSFRRNLSKVEEIARNLFLEIDKILETNTIVNITERLNVLQISQQYFQNTKLFAINSGGKLSSQYNEIITSKLWQNYHRKEAIDLNGWETFENMPMSLNENQFISLFDNNYCLIDGTLAKIIEVDYNCYTSKGIVTYKKKNDFALNKISIFEIA